MNADPTPGQMPLKIWKSAGELSAEDACRWIRGNRHTFNSLLGFMLANAEAGNPCTTRDDVMAYARESHLNVSSIAGIVRDHNIYAALTRYMAMMRPKICKTVKFRKSSLDAVDMVSIWHDEVDARTFFPAKDREEAQIMCEKTDACAR